MTDTLAVVAAEKMTRMVRRHRRCGGPSAAGGAAARPGEAQAGGIVNETGPLVVVWCSPSEAHGVTTLWPTARGVFICGVGGSRAPTVCRLQRHMVPLRILIRLDASGVAAGDVT